MRVKVRWLRVCRRATHPSLSFHIIYAVFTFLLHVEQLIAAVHSYPKPHQPTNRFCKLGNVCLHS